MKKTESKILIASLITITSLFMSASIALADVCSSGISEPPFLSYGVKDNLLLVIDNSGSMLDMAYTDPDDSQCFDDSFSSAQTYAGNYEAGAWYKWVAGPYPEWESGDIYSAGDRVVSNAIIYEAYQDCTAAGSYLSEDTACTWTKLFDFEAWQDTFSGWVKNTAYAVGDLVHEGDMLYKASEACTSWPPANNIEEDTACNWVEQRHSWLESETYSSGDIVTYYGKLFEATGSPATGDSPDDDQVNWTHIEEGTYVAQTGTTATIQAACTAADGDASYNSDVCISIDATLTPEKVTAFYATGKFLNWATASKFDIQKDILTGGKYDPIRQFLIGEHRGCGGRGFVKQVLLESSAATTTDDKYLTMRVRGPHKEGLQSEWDEIDSYDDTTRLDILAVNEYGFDYGQCQPVIEATMDGSIQGDQNKVDKCLEPAPGVDASAYDQRAALNHGLQYCWQSNYNLSKIYGDTGGGAGSCPTVYNAIDAADIGTFANTYHCSGIFDADKEHDDRYGYVGRCWNTGGAVGGADPVCEAKPAVGSADGGCDGDPCTYADAEYKNESGYNYICDKYNSGKDECKDDIYNLLYAWSDGVSGACTAGDIWGGGTATAEFSGEIDGNTATPDPDAVPPAYVGLVDSNHKLDSDAEWVCVYQAMEDYCDDMRIPEVIDPSDQITNTSNSGNLPAILIDSGVLSQLGVTEPLIVLKGYISEATAPEGILQNNNIKRDLRIGVMAFNDNGAKTECDAANTTDVIENYCPSHTEDGAQVLSNILLGNADVGGGRQHIDDVVVAINGTRATSWTPLAEALYTAIGYFTQRTDIRINDDDFYVSGGTWTDNTSYDIGEIVTWTGGSGETLYYQATENGISNGTSPTADSGITWAEVGNPDPITNWCQENHILVITEGASTADTNADMISFVDNAAVNDGDQAGDGVCTGSLNASTYLDDITYIAQNSDAINLYGANYALSTGEDSDGDGNIDYKDKQNITTHIVVAGSLRDDGNDECSPDELMLNAAANGGSALMLGENPDTLKAALLEKLNELRQRASAGSAASVISSSRGGEGAIYQAIFWPELTRELADGTEYTVEWAGDVHALFINEDGYMYEDTNGNRTLEPIEDLNYDGTVDANEDLDGDGNVDGHDYRVVIYFDEAEQKSKACYSSEILTAGTCPATASKALEDVQFLWSAAEWLNHSSTSTAANRIYMSDDHERYIFTWIDLNNNGIVDDDHDGTVDDDDEVRPFIEGLSLDSSSNDLGVSGTWSPVYPAFGVSNSTEVDRIVSWVRGADSLIEDSNANGQLDVITNASGTVIYNEDVNNNGKLDALTEDINGNGTLDAGEDLNGNGRIDVGQRPRLVPAVNGQGTIENLSSFVTWRLGDVIHSTPMTVSEPAEGFHFLYRDRTYADYVAKYKERRHVVYFGGNDGMLHAVNGGFYKEDETKFCLTNTETNGICDESAGNFPELGAEMWAYVPYNILPHLSCLQDVSYAHKYFVDLRPRIFDAKIFSEETECGNATLGYDHPDCIHPQGWGTILVGGMRLGGAPVNAYEINDGVNPLDPIADQVAIDNRQFISSYFILDITNPEEPPVVLGELTQTLDSNGDPVSADLGYSTVISTLVGMKNPGSYTTTTLTETNDWYLILGSGPHGPDAMKGVSDQDAKLSVVPLSWLGADNISSSVGKTALRIPATTPTSGTSGGTWTLSGSPNGFVSDLVTVDFDIDPGSEDYMMDAVYFGTTEGNFFTHADETTSWLGGGKMYRLVTRNDTSYGISFTQEPTTPNQWQMTTLLDLTGTNKPISSAVNVGYDGMNFWVYFGTGRFWDADDKTDTNQHSYFGLKEPMNHDANGNPTSFIWNNPIEFTDTIDSSGVRNTSIATNAPPGDKGLLQVDPIQVALSSIGTEAGLSCLDTTVTSSKTTTTNLNCIPDVIREGTTPDTAYFDNLEKYIAGNRFGDCTNDNINCTDGWYKDFWPYNNRERNLGQATLLGGLVTFTTYQPFNDVCQAEGQAYLYAVYYRTGTSWYENIFGEPDGVDANNNVENKLSLGRGLATSPNLHSGGGDDGPTAFVQTSTGEIKEIEQQNLPIKTYKSGRSKWKEYNP